MEHPLYVGVFVNANELFEIFKPKLSNISSRPHVTIAYRSFDAEDFADFVGSEVDIEVIGYTKSNKNEALQVRIRSDDQQLNKLLDVENDRHITLSYSRDSNAKNSAYLDFEPLEKPIHIKGTLGFMTRRGLVLKRPQ